MSQQRPAPRKPPTAPSEVPNDEKFKELILYISEKSKDDPKFGATKLNKLLFFSDAFAFVSFGRSITGHSYQAIQHGPAPKHLLPMRRAMLRSKEAAIKTSDGVNGKHERLIALRPPRLDGFTGDEISLIDAIIEKFKDNGGGQLSDMTHSMPFWQPLRPKDPISFMSVCIRRKKRTADDDAFAQTLEPVLAK